MIDYKELREKGIEFLSNVLNRGKIQTRVNGCNCSKFNIYNERVVIDNVVIGYILPKIGLSNKCNIDFYEGNVFLITVDITIEKDLNGEKLRLWVNNGTFQVVDIENFDVKEYVDDMLNSWDKETLYDMLERYNCSPSDLAERYLDDLEIEEVVGDLYTQEINNHTYGVKWKSLQGIDSIMKKIKEDEQAILFDNTFSIIKELEKMTSKDLTDDDLYNIGVLINKMFKTDYDNVLKEILKQCDLID